MILLPEEFYRAYRCPGSTLLQVPASPRVVAHQASPDGSSLVGVGCSMLATSFVETGEALDGAMVFAEADALGSSSGRVLRNDRGLRVAAGATLLVWASKPWPMSPLEAEAFAEVYGLLFARLCKAELVGVSLRAGDGRYERVTAEPWGAERLADIERRVRSAYARMVEQSKASRALLRPGLHCASCPATSTCPKSSDELVAAPPHEVPIAAPAATDQASGHGSVAAVSSAGSGLPEVGPAVWRMRPRERSLAVQSYLLAAQAADALRKLVEEDVVANGPVELPDGRTFAFRVTDSEDKARKSNRGRQQKFRAVRRAKGGGK